MRALLWFLVGLLSAVFVAAAIVLIVQNGQSEQITFLGLRFSGYVGWDIAAGAALGLILAFLLLVPGRLASAWRTAGLNRQAQQLEEKLAALREEYARLQGQHGVLRDEHEQLRIAAASQPLTVYVTPSEPILAPLVEEPRLPVLIGVPKPASPQPIDPPAAAPAVFQRLRARLRASRARLLARFKKRRTADDTRPSPRTPAPSTPSASSSTSTWTGR
jgi:uncharacterized membrane protein